MLNRSPDEQNLPSARDESTAEPNDDHGSHSPGPSSFTGNLTALSDLDGEKVVTTTTVMYVIGHFKMKIT